MREIDSKPVKLPEGRAVLNGYMRSYHKNIEQVERENRKMLMRLQDVHSSYDSLKWVQERKQQEKEI